MQDTQTQDQTRKVLVTFPADMHQWLSNRRAQTGAPVTELIRRAVEQYAHTTSANQMKARF